MISTLGKIVTERVSFRAADHAGVSCNLGFALYAPFTMPKQASRQVSQETLQHNRCCCLVYGAHDAKQKFLL